MFTHPLLIAKQKLMMQKTIPIKRKEKHRNHNDLVSIDGKQMLWGEFTSKFYADIENKAKQGKFIEQQEFVLNKDDLNKEKMLYWSH